MNIQEAYNKGLDVAENEAIEKLAAAISGEDTTPFNNPKMESIRQQILNMDKNPVKINNQNLIDVLLDREIDVSELSVSDKYFVEIIKYCKSLINPKSKSKVSSNTHKFLSQLKLDLVNDQAKSS